MNAKRLCSTTRYSGIAALSILLSLILSSCGSSTHNPSSNQYAVSGMPQKAQDPMASRSYSFPSTRVAAGRNVFIFDPKHKMWGAYDASGRLVNQGAASGGRNYCPDVGRACKTPTGTYTVYRKQGPGCVSSKYPLGEGGAPMPYCMHFYKGYAIHGSPHVPNYNASHGCIRVPPSDAAWLSSNFVKPGTKVIVKSY